MNCISEKFQTNKPLSQFSTFGVGGPAKLFIEIHSVLEMQQVLQYCYSQKLAFFILGKGSNVLFDDRGFKGLVILNKIAFCQFTDETVFVGAGYSFALLGVQTARKNLSGLEFASGIPGSVGGALFMNAGASGAKTSDALFEVHFVHENAEVEIFPKEKIEFGYRFSAFQKMRGAIVAAKFLLSHEPSARQKQLTIVDYRTKTQPYSDKSAGCFFRNPFQRSAGALIEECGLKGSSIGGAQISDLHANFIINRKDASAKDILELATFVQSQVKKQKNVDLEFEVRMIPYQIEV